MTYEKILANSKVSLENTEPVLKFDNFGRAVASIFANTAGKHSIMSKKCLHYSEIMIFTSLGFFVFGGMMLIF